MRLNYVKVAEVKYLKVLIICLDGLQYSNLPKQEAALPTTQLQRCGPYQATDNMGKGLMFFRV
jgi:hypothetical protein